MRNWPGPAPGTNVNRPRPRPSFFRFDTTTGERNKTPNSPSGPSFRYYEAPEQRRHRSFHFQRVREDSVLLNLLVSLLSSSIHLVHSALHHSESCFLLNAATAPPSSTLHPRLQSLDPPFPSQTPVPRTTPITSPFDCPGLPPARLADCENSCPRGWPPALFYTQSALLFVRCTNLASRLPLRNHRFCLASLILSLPCHKPRP